MRRLIGIALAVLGTFLIVVALVALTWAPGEVKKTPIDVNSVTFLEGQGGKLDPETGEVADRPIQAVSVTQSDAELSTDELAVFASYSCLNYDEGQEPRCIEDADSDRLITVSEDVFVTDRTTALAVDSELDPLNHEGLIKKWPFDAEQRTYPYWDGVTGQAVDAVFDRVEDINGLETYVYVVEIDEAPIEITEGTPGTYTDRKEISVEPRTGSIINQVETQQRALDNGDLVLDIQAGFTEDEIAGNVSETRDNISTLNLVLRVVPLVGLVLGIPLLLIGLVLILRGRRSRGDSYDEDEDEVEDGYDAEDRYEDEDEDESTRLI